MGGTGKFTAACFRDAFFVLEFKRTSISTYFQQLDFPRYVLVPTTTWKHGARKEERMARCCEQNMLLEVRTGVCVLTSILESIM